jgi:hypothetical protein
VLARLAGEEEHLSAREASYEADLGQGGDVRLAEAVEQPQSRKFVSDRHICIFTFAATLRSTDFSW